MGLFNKKSLVPSELPDLAFDANKKSLQENNSVKIESTNVVQQEKVAQPQQYKPLPVQASVHEGKSLQKSSEMKDKIKYFFSGDEEKGFFKDLLKTMEEETKNLEKLDDWYKQKFTEDDLVTQMRGYWEKNKPQLMLKNMSVQINDKLSQNMEKLHNLEKQWQEIYVQLLQVEEKIRDEEKGIKDVVSEFVKICKTHIPKEKKNKNA